MRLGTLVVGSPSSFATWLASPLARGRPSRLASYCACSACMRSSSVRRLIHSARSGAKPAATSRSIDRRWRCSGVRRRRADARALAIAGRSPVGASRVARAEAPAARRALRAARRARRRALRARALLDLRFERVLERREPRRGRAAATHRATGVEPSALRPPPDGVRARLQPERDGEPGEQAREDEQQLSSACRSPPCRQPALDGCRPRRSTAIMTASRYAERKGIRLGYTRARGGGRPRAAAPRPVLPVRRGVAAAPRRRSAAAGPRGAARVTLDARAIATVRGESFADVLRGKATCTRKSASFKWTCCAAPAPASSRSCSASARSPRISASARSATASARGAALDAAGRAERVARRLHARASTPGSPTWARGRPSIGSPAPRRGAWPPEDTLLVVLTFYTMLSNNESYERAQGVMHAVLPPPLYDFLTPSTSRFDRPVLGSDPTTRRAATRRCRFRAPTSSTCAATRAAARRRAARRAAADSDPRRTTGPSTRRAARTAARSSRTIRT